MHLAMTTLESISSPDGTGRLRPCLPPAFHAGAEGALWGVAGEVGDRVLLWLVADERSTIAELKRHEARYLGRVRRDAETAAMLRGLRAGDLAAARAWVGAYRPAAAQAERELGGPADASVAEVSDERAVLHRDTFGRADRLLHGPMSDGLGAWDDPRGVFSVAGGTCIVTNTSRRAGTFSALDTAMPVDAGTQRVTATVPAGVDGVAVLARCASRFDHYELRVARSGGAVTLRLAKVVATGGSGSIAIRAVQLASAFRVTGEPSTLSLDCAGSTLLALDAGGVLGAPVTDATHPTGRAGIAACVAPGVRPCFSSWQVSL